MTSPRLRTVAVQADGAVLAAATVPAAAAVLAAATALAAFAALSPVASAQEPVASSDDFKLVGEVRDYTTEMPIEGAVVQIADLRLSAVTDRNGYFEFPALVPGAFTFVTSSFGYETNREQSRVGPGNILLVRLNPMVFELPGVEVRAQRLMSRITTRRLSTSASGTTAFTATQMASANSPRGIASFVTERTGFDIYPNVNDQLCVKQRGRPLLVQAYLDEVPVPNLILQTVHPNEVELVEVFHSLAMVRVYTKDFLEKAADKGFAPRPIDLMTERPCP